MQSVFRRTVDGPCLFIPHLLHLARCTVLDSPHFLWDCATLRNLQQKTETDARCASASAEGNLQGLIRQFLFEVIVDFFGHTDLRFEFTFNRNGTCHLRARIEQAFLDIELFIQF